MPLKPIRKWFFVLGERYIYLPGFLGRVVAVLLLPFSVLWNFGVRIKMMLATKNKITPVIPTISVGNLSLGGSGKTPLCVAISSIVKGGAVILRGYGRKSKGLIVVSHGGKIMANVKDSGDEAMLYARLLNGVSVIVSEDRLAGIIKAKELGARYALLDDGFGKFNIKKFDILINPSYPPALPFCLPSGGYRYPLDFVKYANYIAFSGRDFKSSSYIKNPSQRMVLVSAIANPARLFEFFNQSVAQMFFPDHYDFNKVELEGILSKFNATSLLVTQKDYVKIADFGLNVSILEQNTIVCSEFVNRLENFINSGAL